MKKILATALILSGLCSSPTLAEGTSAATMGFGVEGFHDRYREPTATVYERADYFSANGYYNIEQGDMFGAIDARVSHGSSDYKSISGNSTGTPEWEFEGRGRLGYTISLWGGNLSPYTGLGVRYFMQEGKGLYTSLYAGAYDRRILQAYLPIGASYAFTTEGGWTITPLAEFDVLLYGHVNSRLSNVGPIYYNINNTQSANSGYGARGELMFGKAMQGYSWQFGPFVRYWNINDSKLTRDPYGNYWLEPKNDRVQGGVSLRVLW